MLDELATNWPSEFYVRGPGAGLGQDADPELVAFVMRVIQAGASPAAVVALERMNGEVDIRDLLPTISVPALVMCNSRDPLAPAEGVRAMAEAIPGARYVEFPGSTHSVAPNLDGVIATVQEFVTGQPAAGPTRRRLLTILFMDVVGSTERAVELGDARWRELLSAYYRRTEAALMAYDGTEVDRAGDGLLAVFDGPTRAIRCAQFIHRQARELGLELRGGIHTGEVEVEDAVVRGIAVHIAARVCAAAGAADVLVSSTVRDLTAGAGLNYEDRGLHELKGVPEARHLFAVLS
jgi:class 3 adenylate cyclase